MHLLPTYESLSIQGPVAPLLCQTQSKVGPPQVKPRHSALKPGAPRLPLQLLALPVFTDLVSSFAVAAAAALFAVRLTSARYALPTPLPLPSPSAAPAQRTGGVAFSHQPFHTFSCHGCTPPVTSPHLKACQGEQSGAKGKPSAEEGLEVSATTSGVLFLLLRPRSTSLSIPLSPLGLCSLPLSWLATLGAQAGLLRGGGGESQQPGTHQQLCSMGQVEPAGRLPHVGPGGGPARLSVTGLGGALLSWRRLDQAFDIDSRGRGGDVMGEAVGVVGPLQARSQRLVGDFSTAVGLVWGRRASDVYRGGHSSGWGAVCPCVLV